MTRVRQATAADGAAIGRVQVETWRAAYGALLPQEVVEAFDADARGRMWAQGLERVPRPGSATFVAEDGGDVFGFASVGRWRDDAGDAGELYALYVHPSRWGTGAGRALLEQAEQSLRDSGFAEARLWVLDGNERAIRFYGRAGWSHDGVRKAEDFQGAPVTELRFAKTL